MNSPLSASDTSLDAIAVELALLRQMPPKLRLEKAIVWTRQIRQMATNAIRRHHPGLDASEVGLKFIEMNYGRNLAESLRASGIRGTVMEPMHDLMEALVPVAIALQSLEIPFFIGGSVASSFHGAARATMDVDLVCELTEDQIPGLIARIGPDYYWSESAICDAVRCRSCFNLIHLPTCFKLDLFVSRGRPFDQKSMARAKMERIGDAFPIALPIATAEDAIVSKLEWYRLSNEALDQQRSDVVRMLELQGADLDWDYLTHAAQSVGVDDLLRRFAPGP